jgi:hypothetical protein
MGTRRPECRLCGGLVDTPRTRQRRRGRCSTSTTSHTAHNCPAANPWFRSLAIRPDKPPERSLPRCCWPGRRRWHWSPVQRTVAAWKRTSSERRRSPRTASVRGQPWGLRRQLRAPPTRGLGPSGETRVAYFASVAGLPGLTLSRRFGGVALLLGSMETLLVWLLQHLTMRRWGLRNHTPNGVGKNAQLTPPSRWFGLLGR